MAEEKPHVYDKWRDGPLRYLGYANEVGESFKPLVPALLIPSYIVSMGYVLVDSYDKGSKAYNNKDASPDTKHSRTIAKVLDTFIWQGLASVAVPGFTINRVVYFSKAAMAKRAFSPVVKQWAPTLLGLAVIPLIVHPIDYAVDQVMDATLRNMLEFLVDKTGDQQHD